MTASPPPSPSADPDGSASRIASRAPSVRSLAALAVAALCLLSAAGFPAAAQSGDVVEPTTRNVTSAADQRIAGTSTLEPGTELQVRVRSAGETAPQFLKTDAATVAADGSWNATVDLSAIDAHDRVGVTVAVADGNRSAHFELPVRNDEATPTGTDSGVSTPGFGVGVALAALLATGALARRRR